MHYFIDDDYGRLHDMMSAQGQGSTFESFFRHDSAAGRWYCTNESGYLAWLSDLMDADAMEEFINWGYYQIIKSTQGGGVN